MRGSTRVMARRPPPLSRMLIYRPLREPKVRCPGCGTTRSALLHMRAVDPEEAALAWIQRRCGCVPAEPLVISVNLLARRRSRGRINA